MRKYFLFKFTSYSLLSSISQFSIFMLCVGIICWFVLFFVRLCVLFCCLWFLWFWVRKTWFPFGSILPWNVIVLFSSFHLMLVSLSIIYNRITSFFQVNRDQSFVYFLGFYYVFIHTLYFAFHMIFYVKITNVILHIVTIYHPYLCI